MKATTGCAKVERRLQMRRCERDGAQDQAAASSRVDGMEESFAGWQVQLHAKISAWLSRRCMIGACGGGYCYVLRSTPITLHSAWLLCKSHHAISPHPPPNPKYCKHRIVIMLSSPGIPREDARWWGWDLPLLLPFVHRVPST